MGQRPFAVPEGMSWDPQEEPQTRRRGGDTSDRSSQLPGWRTHAKWVQGRIESILEDPGTYGRHLRKIPGAADYMRKALNEIDRIWTIDEAPYRRSEAKRARKKQQEQKEQQRRTRGRRMSP